jgi:isoaspartyl peptidase/L-asparaginase-like protein (Ntn-hydrolase superfamily)
MDLSRRSFLASSALAITAGTVVSRRGIAQAPTAPAGSELPLLVSTWPFGKAANDAGLKVLLAGGSALDAVEQGIGVVEADAHNASVGLGGRPNAAGVVQLDACIMSGLGHRGGSVAALEGIRHPISVARRVMETTPHVMLVGEGARMFALEEGFESVRTDAQDHERHAAWHRKRAAERKNAPAPPGKNHDTIALVVLGADRQIAGGFSTSGLGNKLPGRVGDSPILGSGLYVDNEVGAAGATGIGENVMRYCGSFMVVEYMRQGLHPQEACIETIRRIARQDPKGLDLSINFVALDKQGRYGAAGTGQGFPYSVTTRLSSRVLQSPGVNQPAGAPAAARP